METRLFTQDDFHLIESWLKYWFPKGEFTKDIYPDTGIFTIDRNTKEPIYVGFVWCPKTSKMAQLGFIIRNPNYKIPKSESKQTLKTHLLNLISYAKELGYEYVMTWTASQTLKEGFKEVGMLETSSSVSEFIVKI